MFIILFLVALTGCIKSLEEKVASSVMNGSLLTPYNSNNYDRLLIVVFSEKNINKSQNTALLTPNDQQSNSSKDSSWRNSVSDDLAADYKLIKLNDWPITEVGEQCVLYLIRHTTAISAVINSLSKDNRINIVQWINTFNIEAQQNIFTNINN